MNQLPAVSKPSLSWSNQVEHGAGLNSSTSDRLFQNLALTGETHVERGAGLNWSNSDRLRSAKNQPIEAGVTSTIRPLFIGVIIRLNNPFSCWVSHCVLGYWKGRYGAPQIWTDGLLGPGAMMYLPAGARRARRPPKGRGGGCSFSNMICFLCHLSIHYSCPPSLLFFQEICLWSPDTSRPVGFHGERAVKQSFICIQLHFFIFQMYFTAESLARGWNVDTLEEEDAPRWREGAGGGGGSLARGGINV